MGYGLQHALAGTSGGAGLWGRPERPGRQGLYLGEALPLSPPQLLRTFPCKVSEQNGAGNCWFFRTLSRDAVVTPKGLCRHRHLSNQEPACSPRFGAESPRLGPSLGELSSVCHCSENHLWLEVGYECPLLSFVGVTGPRATGGMLRVPCLQRVTTGENVASLWWADGAKAQRQGCSCGCPRRVVFVNLYPREAARSQGRSWPGLRVHSHTQPRLAVCALTRSSLGLPRVPHPYTGNGCTRRRR